MKNDESHPKFYVLMLCKTSERRNLIQQGLNEIKAFEHTRHMSAPEDVDAKLSEFVELHLILISPEYNLKQVKSFIEAAKKHRITNEAAFVMLLDVSKPEEMELLQEAGVDEFLIPPYTVDTFENLATITHTILRKRSYNRRRNLITDKLEAFINQLNLVAMNKRTDSKDLLMNQDLLKQLEKSLGPLPREEAEMYLEALMDVLTNPERQRKRIGYIGASNRVRKKFERLLEEEVSVPPAKGR